MFVALTNHVSEVQLSASFHVTYDEVARCECLQYMIETDEANVPIEYRHWSKLGEIPKS